jgi:diguanylate cyclase (GGDEF)-like protein
MLLLEHGEGPIGRVEIAAAYALAVGCIALVGAWSLKRWFERQIASPLRQLSARTHRSIRGWQDPSDPRLTRWHETADLAEQSGRLLHTLAETEARVERMELEMERQIQQREVGFHRQLRRARDRARLDPLTGLGNRSYLEEKIGPLLSQQSAAKEDLAAVMVDVDNFKAYNDTHGHQAGDVILKFAGALLRGGIRPTDHAIRYGGDEFLLLLPDTSAHQAEVIVERLLKLFRQYVTRLDRGRNLSLSAGVASLTDHQPKSGQDLIAKADAALYEAKRKGKNIVKQHQKQEATADRSVLR